ncbi:formate hydrogenlyase maturation protein HycH [Acetobacteraceae bacterium]|nr:formate hydrogenlyase maturation protein HycH [Acetobacteraceae bacterium]
MTNKTANVVFYALGRKFVNEEKAKPDAQQLVYYSLAIGHHIGVIDCLEEKLSIPVPEFKAWIEKLPEGETARRKLEGLLKFGEIIIDSTHIHPLALALDRAMDKMTEQEKGWAKALINLLGMIDAEPSIYFIVRRKDG